MSSNRFKTQAQCDKFHAKLDALKDEYVDGIIAPDEAYEILTGEYDYGQVKATALIELWRVKYNAGWAQFDPRTFYAYKKGDLV